jgi:hypothetical protein
MLKFHSMTHAILQKNTFLVAMLALAIFLVGVAPAFAQAAETCKVRADVSVAEVTELTGKAGGPYTSGSTPLALTGANAGDNGLICTYSLIKFLVNVGTFVIFTVATLLFLVAGFLYLTAGASATNKDKAKDFMVFGVLGLIVALLARVIPAIVRSVIAG